MTRLASMIIPLLIAAAALVAGAAHAGEYYERVGVNRYKPADDAWYSSTCCYKKIVKHITISKTVWVKVPPPAKPHRHHDDDDAVDVPRPGPALHHKPQVVELGAIIHTDQGCRKAVPVRDRSTTVIVLVNVSCR